MKDRRKSWRLPLRNASYRLPHASRNADSSWRTRGKSRNRPSMLGKTIAKIIASEKSITDPSEIAAPITTTMQNSSL
ncbi:hypothetical protein LF1_33310 [Rubripirellula obstinata]|uniref:Uncharacterized protein n=1 Tax=Rubripirellula obstinata TaxID=406547 RepID=A0A5B1CLX5_9BACT|nr:hypothetical protein LF1_33310 [Rubripirellula obstinata]